MESQYLHNAPLITHILGQMIEACELITSWNVKITSSDDYLTSPEGVQTMAASCMLIESIGEGVKKIDRLTKGLLYDKFPNTQWKEIMGLRDHIAHGYFNIDADIIFDVAKTEIPSLKETLSDFKNLF
ncbi:MAG: DUF86 domain-containing protein [Bacteroides sp.]|nr:DUF86 domain-containing protein [Bacteroides sp.]MBD5359224.1 DUF86 domain-containing protein [Bacteroides sp.]MBD5361435.1 DUF86 domain-containing protein [Bacteroides sp.]MBD5371827.1 DUF86 domain-containing protein [Bacteroides sp.]